MRVMVGPNRWRDEGPGSALGKSPMRLGGRVVGDMVRVATLPTARVQHEEGESAKLGIEPRWEQADRRVPA